MTIRHAKPAPFERTVHIAIVDYLRRVLPEGYIVAHLYQNPRSAAGGALAKRMGMIAGIPDIEIQAPGGMVYRLEVKREGGVLSPAQKRYRTHCIEYDMPWALVHCIDEAREALIGWGVATREHAA